MRKVCSYLYDRGSVMQKLPRKVKVKKQNPVFFTSFILEFDIDILMDQMVMLD